MAIVAWPLSAGTFTAEQTRQALAALCGSAPTGRPLGASTGVRPGTPATTVSIAGSGPYTWAVAPHAGVLDVETSAAAGPYLYAVNAAATGSVPAAHASLGRVDLLSVQLSDSTEGDGTAAGSAGVAVVYTQGVALATPAEPATPVRALALAQVSVPSVASGQSPSVTWVAPSWTGAQVAYAFGSQTTGRSIPTGVWTTVYGWGGGGAKNLGVPSGVGTIVVPGLYQLSAQVAYPPIAGPTGQRAARITVNGAVVAVSSTRPDATYNTYVPVECIANLVAGDTFTVDTLQSQGAATALATTAGGTVLAVNRVSDS